MRKMFILISCLAFFAGVAEAKGQCNPGWKYRLVRSADGSTAGCTDGKTFDGYVQIRNRRNVLLMAGEFHHGQMDGVWKVYDDKGHVVKKPLFDKGKMVAEDSMSDEEADGGD